MNHMSKPILLICLLLFISGCGDTIHQQLDRQFHHAVVQGDQQSVVNACNNSLKSMFGNAKPAKNKDFITAGPIKYTDPKTNRPGRITCLLTVVPASDCMEVYVQVKKEVLFHGAPKRFTNEYDYDEHTVSSPMITGENLPSDRQRSWRYVGRDRNRESQILEQVNLFLQPAN